MSEPYRVIKKLTDKLRTRRGLNRDDEQFIASGRITTLNAIATCFAHQINNPLQIIHNSIDSLSKKIPSGEQSMSDDLEKLRDNADRIHDLIQHLYRLVKNDSKHSESLLVRDVLDSAYALFEEQLKNRGVVVELNDTDVCADGAVVYGNRIELEQVFINLFANARDALALALHPRISVTLTETSDHQLKICFADNGAGISTEHREQVFDSLFTTKSDGTGLGLWLCLSVINQMDGKIKVESQLGEGTTFTISLPTR
jgi:signal transduction histidine kinase